jgi:hypothetical protein
MKKIGLLFVFLFAFLLSRGQEEYKGWLPYYPPRGADTTNGVFIKNGGVGYAGFYAIRGTDTLKLHIDDNGKGVLDWLDTLWMGAFHLYYLNTAAGTLYINGETINTNVNQSLSYDATNHEVDITAGGTSAIIPYALDDGATEGLASFTAADFNVTSANVAIDYANGQAADATHDGFLQMGDWGTFNSKLSSEVDGSISNEGSLTVEAGGANDAEIHSNTSTSTDVVIAGGTNITVTEGGSTITITASSSGDNLGNHIATQALYMGTGANYYDIRHSDSVYAQTFYGVAGDAAAESALEISSNGSRATAIIERKVTAHYGIEYPLQLQAYGTTSNSDGQGIGIKFAGKDDLNNWEDMGEYGSYFSENGNGVEESKFYWKLRDGGSALSTEMTLTPDQLELGGLLVNSSNVKLTALSSSTSSNFLYVQTDGTITKGAATGGTVTSVAMTVPESELGVTGTPITTSGTLALSWDSQTANKVFASPNGTTGVPTFRALLDDDVPNTITCSNYEPTLTKGNFTSLATSLSLSSIRQVIGGTLTIDEATGYSIPTDTQIGNWNDAYTHSSSTDQDISSSNEIQSLTWTPSTRTMSISGGGSGDDIDLFSTTGTDAGLTPGSSGWGASYYLNGNGGWSVPTGTAHPSTYTLAVGTGLSIDAGANRLHTGNSTISIASGYYLPQTADQTNWNDAYTHSSSTDQDISSSNEIQSLTWTPSTRTMSISGGGSGDDIDLFSTTGTDAGLTPGSSGWGASYYLNGNGGWSVPTGTAHPSTYTLAVGTGLSIDAGANRLHTGNSTISIASGYYLPQTADQTNWNTAYGWGNHASAGYLTSESQTLYWDGTNGHIELNPGGDADIGKFSISGTTYGFTPGSNGETAKYLRGDGTWATPPDNNTLYTEGFGIDITSEKVSLGNSSGELSDPNANKILWWNDTGGDMGWLGISTGVKISSSSLMSDDPNIDHDQLKNFLQYEHYKQKDIDTVSSDLTGFLYATAGLLSTSTVSSYWTYSSPNLYPNNTSDKVVIGGTTPTSGYELTVTGDIIASANITTNGWLYANTSATVEGILYSSYIQNPEDENYLEIHAGYPSLSSGSAFYMDADEHKMGIDEASPAYNLDVGGTFRAQGTSKFTSIGNYTGTDSIAVFDGYQRLGWKQLSATGYWTVNGNDLYPTSTSYIVGIGNTNPVEALDVTGDIKASIDIHAGNTFYGASLDLTDDAQIDGDATASNFYGQMWLPAGGTNTITYANNSADGTLYFYNDYDNATTFWLNSNGATDFNYDVNVDGDLTVQGEDVFLTGDAPNIQFGDGTNDGTLSFYSDKDNFTTMTINSDSTVSVNDDLLVYGETQMLGGWRQSVVYYPDEDGDITMSQNYIVWIVDPEATGVELSATAAMEVDGQTITIVNDNRDDENFILTFKNSTGDITQKVDGMSGYESKSGTFVYSRDGGGWFLIGFSAKSN